MTWDKINNTDDHWFSRRFFPYVFPAIIFFDLWGNYCASWSIFWWLRCLLTIFLARSFLLRKGYVECCRKRLRVWYTQVAIQLQNNSWKAAWMLFSTTASPLGGHWHVNAVLLQRSSSQQCLCHRQNVPLFKNVLVPVESSWCWLSIL